MTIVQAKEYIYQELQELPVRAGGSSLRWREETDRIVLKLSDGDDDHAGAGPPELGGRELARGMGCEGNGAQSWRTCCLEFDRRAGWNRQRAEEWVARHLGTRDAGRTTRLDVPYRMHPDLAAALSVWLAKSYRLVRQGHTPDRSLG